MKSIRSALICAVIVGMGVEARADQSYEWTGGAADFGGLIVLDSSSNAAGSLTDIVAAGIFTPQGGFSFDPSSAILLQPDFAWNPSQITDMFIAWSVGPSLAGFGENVVELSGANLVISEIDGADGAMSADLTGSWQAVPGAQVPDAAPTALLVGLGLLGIALASRKRFAAV
jgi:hypothetical protein